MHVCVPFVIFQWTTTDLTIRNSTPATPSTVLCFANVYRLGTMIETTDLCYEGGPDAMRENQQETRNINPRNHYRHFLHSIFSPRFHRTPSHQFLERDFFTIAPKHYLDVK